jgi:hypothetical protein
MPCMSPLVERIYKRRGLGLQIFSRFENLESRAVQTIGSLLGLHPGAAEAFGWGERITLKGGRFVAEGGAP